METFKKEERLYSKKVIEHLFSEGSSFFVHPYKVIWCDYRDKGIYPARILISVSKHSIRSAVKRNRLKRQMREIYRKNKHRLYNYLERNDKQCVFSIIYTAKDVLPYEQQEKKIILILQRLEEDYEKLVE